MKTPLAILNLRHQGVKTLVSIGGVAFALLLVFMQLGFMGAVSYTATNVFKNLDYDIAIRSTEYVHLYEPSSVDRDWVNIAAGVPGVASAKPLWVMIHNWRTMPSADQIAGIDVYEPQYLPIAVMGCNANQNVFDLPYIQAAFESGQLLGSESLLLDDSTQVDYGPLYGFPFASEDVGRQTEIAGKEFTIVGLYKLGTGLAANGAAIVNEQGFARIAPWDVRKSVSLVLIKVADGADRKQVLKELRRRAQLNQRMGDADHNSSTATLMSTGSVVEVLSSDQILNYERFRWIWQTPIGLIFQLGVVLSLIVGAAIVYMVLATDVANRLPEYATLLAMGYSRKYLASIVLTQAAVLGVLGFLASWVGTEVLYRLTSIASGIPMMNDAFRIILVSGLGLLTCVISGTLALRKLWKAEPANLF